MKRILYFLTLAAVLISFAACNKSEGEGGESTAQGYVYKVKVNDDLSRDTFPACDERVQIYFGENDNAIGKDTRTGYDGFYRFKYLRKGAYRVVAYTQLTSGEKLAVSKQFRLGSDVTRNVEDIYIEDGKSLGAFYVSGMLMQVNIKKTSPTTPTSVQDSIYVTDKPRPYLRKEGDPVFIADARPENGKYEFTRLEKGVYTVWVVFEHPETNSNEDRKGTVGLKFELTDQGEIILIESYNEFHEVTSLDNKRVKELPLIITRVNL